VLFFATLFEYLILFTNIGWLIYEMVKNKGKTKVPFLVYKNGHQNNVKLDMGESNDKTINNLKRNQVVDLREGAKK
jgi:hypothetical protein